MSLHYIFSPTASGEFFDAIEWYNGESPGLGKEFTHEVFQVLDRACLQPEIFRKVRGRARKVRLQRFSAYSIYFAIKEDTLSVIAVFHGARNPSDLRKRLK